MGMFGWSLPPGCSIGDIPGCNDDETPLCEDCQIPLFEDAEIDQELCAKCASLEYICSGCIDFYKRELLFKLEAPDGEVDFFCDFCERLDMEHRLWKEVFHDESRDG